MVVDIAELMKQTADLLKGAEPGDDSDDLKLKVAYNSALIDVMKLLNHHGENEKSGKSGD